jgi:hypothetical protein
VIENNIMRLSGYGWGQQRHNVDTPAHVKGWSYMNTARDFSIRGNIFDRAAYRMIHTVAKSPESLPLIRDNTYIQNLGAPLGSFGANEIAEPPVLQFDENAEQTIKTTLGDTTARVWILNK